MGGIKYEAEAALIRVYVNDIVFLLDSALIII